MEIHFSKYSGCGNDFILIDNRQQFFEPARSNLIARLCHRRLGIGADGIVLLEESSKADFRMRIFNADGGEAEMCGNGLRCLVRFIQELGIDKESISIETMHQIITTIISEDFISAMMPAPETCYLSKELNIEGRTYTLHSINTGVPHVVIFVENLEDSTWMAIAPKIRHHPNFFPHGTNVNFALFTDQEVKVRTYERGVEGETLACGTGAAAVAIAAACIHQLSSPITIRPQSNETIKIAFPSSLIKKYQIQSNTTGSFEPHTETLTMTGPADKIFSGVFSY